MRAQHRYHRLGVHPNKLSLDALLSSFPRIGWRYKKETPISLLLGSVIVHTLVYSNSEYKLFKPLLLSFFYEIDLSPESSEIFENWEIRS